MKTTTPDVESEDAAPSMTGSPRDGRGGLSVGGGGVSQAPMGQGPAVCPDDRSLAALSDGVVGRGALESLPAGNENVDRHVAAARWWPRPISLHLRTHR